MTHIFIILKGFINRYATTFPTFQMKYCVRRLPSRNINNWKETIFLNNIIIIHKFCILTGYHLRSNFSRSVYLIIRFSKSTLFSIQNVSKKMKFLSKSSLFPVQNLEEITEWTRMNSNFGGHSHFCRRINDVMFRT